MKGLENKIKLTSLCFLKKCGYISPRNIPYGEDFIPDDSELRIIENFVFARTAIVSFKFPSKLTQVVLKAFSNCRKLQ